MTQMRWKSLVNLGVRQKLATRPGQDRKKWEEAVKKLALLSKKLEYFIIYWLNNTWAVQLWPVGMFCSTNFWATSCSFYNKSKFSSLCFQYVKHLREDNSTLFAKTLTISQQLQLQRFHILLTEVQQFPFPALIVSFWLC